MSHFFKIIIRTIHIKKLRYYTNSLVYFANLGFCYFLNKLRGKTKNLLTQNLKFTFAKSQGTKGGIKFFKIINADASSRR